MGTNKFTIKLLISIINLKNSVSFLEDFFFFIYLLQSLVFITVYYIVYD